ncbi:glutamyl-tRNA reductase [bacterium F11]|nr:glutamyl-tRNA reductase [bacterium F11]
MGVVLVGLSHKTAPLQMREHLTVPKEKLEQALVTLQSQVGVKEAVVLSTCNRLEVYAHPEKDPKQTFVSLSSFFKDLYKAPKLTSSLYKYQSQDAILHLFRVASGLDSLVIGESEILGQIKSAYLTAHQHGSTGKITNVLFQRALFVGKQVRVQTDISEGASSVASIAVQLALRIFGELAHHHVLLLGAGTMAEVTTRHLISQKAGHLTVLNRTPEKAKELAKLLNGKGGSLDQLETELLKADIVICSVSSDNPFINEGMVAQIMKQRRQRSLYFIDIAVPRNVHPKVHDLDNVYVYNLDDLQGIVDENLVRRKKAVTSAESFANERAKEFQDWISGTLKGDRVSLRHYPNKG